MSSKTFNQVLMKKIIKQHLPSIDPYVLSYFVETIEENAETLNDSKDLYELESFREWLTGEYQPPEAKELCEKVFMDLWYVNLIGRKGIENNEEETENEEENLEEGCCLICERKTALTAHHLIPKTTHKHYLKKGYTMKELSKTIGICRPCHSAVHRAEDEKTLAESWNTLEKLLTHPKIIAFIPYIQKQKVRSKEDAQNPKLRYQR